jgi:hypothetical protein
MPKQRDLQREVLRLQLLRRADVLLYGVMAALGHQVDRLVVTTVFTSSNFLIVRGHPRRSLT